MEKFKLKSFADKVNVAQRIIFYSGSVENIVENGENCLPLFPMMFSKPFFFQVVKPPFT